VIIEFTIRRAFNFLGSMPGKPNRFLAMAQSNQGRNEVATDLLLVTKESMLLNETIDTPMGVHIFDVAWFVRKIASHRC